MTSRIVPDPTRTTAMSDLVFSIRRKTRLDPSGDQRGWVWATASLESEVIWRGLRPRTSVTQMRRPPARSASKARLFPSGENEGLNPFSTSLASRPVPGSMVHSSPVSE